MQQIGGDDLPLPHSCVVALARITNVHQDCGGECSTWAMKGDWHWQLADVHALTDPVPVPRGRQGLWIPDHDLRHRTADALPAGAGALAAALRPPAG